MGFIQEPVYFQYTIEDILRGRKGIENTLRIVVCLGDMAVFSNLPSHILVDTIMVIKKLTFMEFVINLINS